MTDSTPLILRDNASPHKAKVVKELLESYHWEVLDHPPYTPDLSPSDFDLFPKLKDPYGEYATRVWMKLSVL